MNEYRIDYTFDGLMDWHVVIEAEDDEDAVEQFYRQQPAAKLISIIMIGEEL